MKFHPDVLRAHAEFGGDLESMQRLYDSYDQAATITALRDRVAEVERERDEARLLVTEANNSLYGSQSYFHSRNGGPFDKYHLAREIDRLKSELGELTESLKYAENDFIKACNLAAAAEARATAAEAAIARLRDEVIEALSKARVYVEMIVTDQFADTGTDKQDLAEIDAAIRALNRDTHHETR